MPVAIFGAESTAGDLPTILHPRSTDGPYVDSVPPLSIAVGLAGREAIALAPMLSLPAAADPEAPRIRFYDFPRQFGLIFPAATYEQASGKSWQDQNNDAGTGTMTLSMYDPDIELARSDRIVRCDLDGVAVFAWLVEQRDRKAIDQGEEGAAESQISGRGVLGMWEEAVVYPEFGYLSKPVNEQRAFNFAADAFDDTHWGVPIRLQYQFQNPHAGPPTGWYGAPKGWPAPAAGWVWSRPKVGGAMPVGSTYYRRRFNLAQRYHLALFVAADDGYELWLDGTMLDDKSKPGDGGHYGEATRYDIEMSAGDHLLAVRAVNDDNGATSNIAGLIVAAMAFRPNEPLSLLFQTQGFPDDTAGWTSLDYAPNPPGFTPGRIIRILLQEAQARGALVDWDLGFSDTYDTAGKPWPVVSDVTFEVGMDYLSCLKQMAESYIDLAVAPALLRLNAWVAGTRGRVTSTRFGDYGNTVDLDDVNIVELSHSVEG